jgi:Uncharacterized protein conserved in bacteria (DUF2188)
VSTTRYLRGMDGVWEVLEEGAKRGAMRADTKAKAVAQARKIVKQQGGGEVRVVNRAGKRSSLRHR